MSGTDRRCTWPTLRVGALAAVLAAAGCAASGTYFRHDFTPTDEPVPAVETIDTSLILIGDAGKLTRQPEPVLEALAEQAARVPDRTAVVFLGDNIYPHGLPEPGARDRAHAEQALEAQIAAVVPAGARAIFVPGNHDYAGTGWRGLERQRRYLADRGNPRLQALPDSGCPGPQTLDLGERLRLVLLDTQWWFESGPRPLHPQSHCPCDSEDEIVSELGRTLASPGDRHVVVAAHHPLVTHGPHGGFFSWKEHLFPLREWNEWMWVPLPVLGSAYVFARQIGITEQDLSHGRYEHLKRGLESALGTRAPLVYAAGHEHTLQILEAPGARLHVVSGAGTVDRRERVRGGDNTLYVSDAAGFVRIDFLRDGRARLEIFEVDEIGPRGRRAFWIAPEPQRTQPAPAEINR